MTLWWNLLKTIFMQKNSNYRKNETLLIIHPVDVLREREIMVGSTMVYQFTYQWITDK